MSSVKHICFYFLIMAAAGLIYILLGGHLPSLDHPQRIFATCCIHVMAFQMAFGTRQYKALLASTAVVLSLLLALRAHHAPSPLQLQAEAAVTKRADAESKTCKCTLSFEQYLTIRQEELGKLGLNE